MLNLDRAKFRVKIKSLAAEAGFIRLEERRARQPEDLNSLHFHRVYVVRAEARSTLIAYAFARGVPYCAVERTEREFDHKRVRDIIRTLTGQIVSPKDLSDWKAKSLVTA